MNIILNGEEKQIAPDLTILELLNSLNLEPGTVVIEYNTVILAQDDYEATIIVDGSKIELIRFVGGG